jgi:hypothetical protein
MNRVSVAVTLLGGNNPRQQRVHISNPDYVTEANYSKRAVGLYNQWL